MKSQPLGHLARWSAKHRVGVLAATAVLMMVLGGGILQLEFDDNPLDAMPDGHPNTVASNHLLDEFPGSAYTGAVFVVANPDKWEAGNAQLPNRVPLTSAEARDGQDAFLAAFNQALGQASQGQATPIAGGVPGPNNITDEVYMRGMEEFFLFLTDRIPEMKWGITLPSQIKLVNYTNSGIPNVQPLDESAFSMPATDPEGSMQFSSAWQTYWQASPESIRTIVSLDWTTTRMGLLHAPGDASLAVIGQKLYDAVDEYRAEVEACDAGEACSLEWNVFDPDGIIVDPRAPVASAAYLSKTTVEDIVRLAPFVALFIGGALMLAFRRPGIVAAMLLPMGLAGIGVLGTFGLIRLPIQSVSLLVFPILMGNGIDFAIHMANGYNRARSRGASPHEAAFEAGETAGTPLFIATMTTLAGILLLIFAPNKLITQLGLAIFLGMALLLVISLTALPAALTWTKPSPTGQELLTRGLMANARFWQRNRWVAVALVVAGITGGALAASSLDTLTIGTPAAFFPEGDAQRADFERSNELYYKGQEDLVTNVLVLEGDITTPEAMDLMRDLEAGIKELDFVKEESAVSLYFALNAWIQVREGTAGAPLVIAQESAQPGSTFPETQEEIKALIDEMFDTPLATYASFFTNHPDYDIATVLIEIEQPQDFDQLEELWNRVNIKVEEVAAAVPGHDMEIHMSGSTAVAYLFTKEELPYVQIASFIGLGLTGFLVLAIRRSPRDAVTVAAVVGSSGMIWIGALALLNIPLSIALVVPVVMIAAIGSDYALHLRYGVAKEGAAAWGLVGRAVFYSAMTDLGAFLIFTQMRYGILRDATVATAAALSITLVVTLLLAPALASRDEVGQTPAAAPAPVPSEVRS